MFCLKLPYDIKFMALVFLSLLPACEKEAMLDGSNEHSSGPVVATTPVPATPQMEEPPTPRVDSPPPAAQARSADSFNLTIRATPFTDTSHIGSGEIPDSDWLESKGHAADLDKMPADDNLLPDMFKKEERDKSTSVKMDVLFDDGEQEIADVIDGAGVSIQYKHK